MELKLHHSAKQSKPKIAYAFLVHLACLGLMFYAAPPVSAASLNDSITELGDTVLSAVSSLNGLSSVFDGAKDFVRGLLGFGRADMQADSKVKTAGNAKLNTRASVSSPKTANASKTKQAIAPSAQTNTPAPASGTQPSTQTRPVINNYNFYYPVSSGAFQSSGSGDSSDHYQDLQEQIDLIIRQLDPDRPNYSMGQPYVLPHDLEARTLDIGTGNFTVSSKGNVSTEGDLHVVGNFSVAGSQELSGASLITASSANPLMAIDQGGSGAALRADNIALKGSTISTDDTDTSLLINPNGTGAVQFHTESNYIDSTGSLVLDGDVTLTGGGTFYTTGNGNLVFAPNGTGNLVVGGTGNAARIVPFEDSTIGYDLGAATARWYDIYAKGKLDLDGTTLTSDHLSFINEGTVTTGASKDLTLQPGAGGKTRITDGTDYVDVADGTQALYAVKGAKAVKLADGTYSIDATGDVRLSGDITVNGGKIVFNGANESIDNETADLLKLATGGNARVVLGDAGGAGQFQIADSTGAVVASIDSDGRATVTGLAASGQMTFAYQPSTTDFTDSSLLVNPAAAIADAPLVAAGVNGTRKFSVDAEGDAYFAGNVGVGTAASSYALNVSGTVNAVGEGYSNTYYGTAGASGGFVFNKASGTAGSPTAVSANNRLGRFGFTGYDGVGFTTTDAAIIAFAAENFSTTAKGTYLTFETKAIGTNTRLERLRVDSTGNIGIGTTVPLNKLSVYTTTSTDGLSIDGTTYPAILLKANGALKGYAPFVATASGGFFGDSLVGDMGFRSESNRILFGVGTGNSTMAVSGTGVNIAGNVGIGTTSPAYKLDVNGTLNASSTITGPNGATIASFGSGSRITLPTTGASYIGNGGNAWIGYTSAAGLWFVDSATGDIVYRNAQGQKLLFGIDNGAGTANSTLAINAGNVGIGTTVPAAVLEVVGQSRSSRNGVAAQYLQLNGGDSSGIYLQASGANKQLIISNFSNSGIYDSNNIQFQIGNSNTPITALTILNTSGSVGIGTVSPAQQLEVSGIGRFSRTTNSANYLEIGAEGGLGSINSVGGVALAIKMSGSEKVRFSSAGGVSVGNGYAATDPGAGNMIISGSVGIGTTGPLAKLSIGGAGSAGYDLFISGKANFNGTESNGFNTYQAFGGWDAYGSDASTDSLLAIGGFRASQWQGITFGANGSEAMRISSTGSVGIGTTVPAAKLHLSGAGVKLKMTDTDAPALTLGMASEVGGQLIDYGTNYSQLGSNDLTHTGGFFRIDTRTGYEGQLFSVYNVAATTGTGTKVFYVGTTGNTTAEGNLVINGTGNTTIAGNVGIGTTGPATKLEVRSGSDLTSAFRISGNDGTETSTTFSLNNGIAFVRPADTSINFGISTSVSSASAGGNITFSPNSDTVNNSPVERLRITKSGNVGIGTTNPGSTLEINSASSNILRLSRTAGGKIWDLGVTPATASGRFTIGNTTDGEILSILPTTGNVGIGIAAPTAKLDLSGNFSAGQISGVSFSLTNSTGGSAGQNFALISGSKSVAEAYSQNGLQIITSLTAATGTQNILRGMLNIARNTGAATVTQASALHGRVDNTSTGTITDAYAALIDRNINSGGGTISHNYGLYLEDQSGVGSANYNIYSNGLATNYFGGNVGVGTTTPTQKLEVNGAGVFTGAAATASSSGVYVSYGDAVNTGRILSYSPGVSIRDLNIGGKNLVFSTGTVSVVEAMRVNSSGSVGIGTAAPAVKLHVNGSAIFSGTSTAGTDGEFVYDTTAHAYKYYSSGDSAWHSLGSGTISYTGTLWTQSGSNIYYNSGSVGIGTAAPANTLSLNSGSIGIGANAGAFPYGISIARDNGGIRFANTADSQIGAIGLGTLTHSGGSDSDIGLQSAGNLIFSAGGTSEKVRISTSGNVGIGTASPGARLDVNGSGAGHVMVGEWGGNSAYGAIGFNSVSGTNYNLAGSSGNNNLFINRGTGGNIYFRENNGDQMMILSSGNVGIGTTSPAATLHVAAASTTAASLTWGAAAGTIFRAEGSELAMGLLNASPYPYWIQARTSGSTARDIALQPLGGSVGIGTTGPGDKLDVAGNVRISTSGYLYRSASTDGNILLSNNTGSSYVMGVGVRGSGATSYLDFGRTTSVGVAVANGMTLDSTGNVGIGTTNPGQTFNVANNSYVQARFQGTASGNSGGIELWGYGSGGIDQKWEIQSVPQNVLLTGGGLIFYDRTDNRYAMTIDTSGSVGIGTTGPLAKLDIRQSGAATGVSYGLYAANTATSATDSINKYGMYVSSTGVWSGASAVNYGLYIDTTSGGASNFGLAVKTIPATGSAANVYYDSATGVFYYNASSERYKTDIGPLDL